jgi:peptide/nickel transport system permease protein
VSGYVLRRLTSALIVVLLTAVLLALSVHLVPGDPARIVLGEHATPELIAMVRARMGLDDPIALQVWHFVSGAVQGDLGTDFVESVPVTTLIGQVLPDTLALAFVSILLALLIGIPFGIALARWPGGILDRVSHSLSMIFISAPAYVTSLVLLLIFAVKLRYLPAIGAGQASAPLDYLKHMILPAAALAVFWWGYLPRLLRATMLEVMGTQYIRNSRAFGLRERVIFYRYALRNALLPLVALFGLMMGYSLTGTVYAENIFARPGLGSLALTAIGERDWPVIRGVVLMYALFFIFGNLLADLSYRILDPRIKLEDDVGAGG